MHLISYNIYSGAGCILYFCWNLLHKAAFQMS